MTALLGALGALVVGLALAAGSIEDPYGRWRAFEALLAGVGLAAAVALVLAARARPAPRGTIPWLLATGFLARLAFLPSPPSDDVNRYLWEGRVQLHGVNPYAVAPDDPSLEPLRDETWAGINHPDWTAIYGPAAEASFAAAARAGAGATGWKAVVVAIDLLVAGVLARILAGRGLSPLWLAGWLWHPLVLWTGAGEGHLESLLVLPVAGAVLALDRDRPLAAGALLAAAALVKATALPFLALLVAPRLRPGAFVWAATVFGLGHAPYLGAGRGLFASVLRFGLEMESGAFLALPSWLAAAGLAAVLLVLALGRVEPSKVALHVAGATLLVSPTVHPWYAVPLAATAVLAGPTLWWIPTFTLVALGETTAVLRATGDWVEAPWLRAAVYGPFLAALLGRAVRGRGVVP